MSNIVPASETQQAPPQALSEVNNMLPFQEHSMGSLDVQAINFAPLQLNLDKTPQMSLAANDQLGVTQELKGLFRAGDSLFGLVRAQVGGQDKLLVTLIPGKTGAKGTEQQADEQRALIMGMVDATKPGEVIRVGRNHQQVALDLNEATKDRAVSREHFSVTVGMNGEVVVEGSSTNPTDFISHKTNSFGKAHTESFKWSVKSKELLEKSKSPEQEKFEIPPVMVDLGKNAIGPVGIERVEGLTEHQKEIFASPETADATIDAPLDYDDLFASDEEYAKKNRSVEHAAVRKTEGRTTTDVTEDKAAERLLKSNVAVKRLVESFVTEATKNSRDIIKLVRTNNELRYRLAEYLLGEIGKIPGMPDRIMRNTEKSPKHKGYKKMQSREYATLLALSMIDGTFDPSAASKSDGIKIEAGEVELGQHRYAAMKLLGLQIPDVV